MGQRAGHERSWQERDPRPRAACGGYRCAEPRGVMDLPLARDPTMVMLFFSELGRHLTRAKALHAATAEREQLKAVVEQAGATSVT